MALFGSKQERDVKSKSNVQFKFAYCSCTRNRSFVVTLPVCYLSTEESASAEPAWKGTGQKVGIKIWRIVVCTRLYIVCSTAIYCINPSIITEFVLILKRNSVEFQSNGLADRGLRQILQRRLVHHSARTCLNVNARKRGNMKS